MILPLLRGQSKETKKETILPIFIPLTERVSNLIKLPESEASIKDIITTLENDSDFAKLASISGLRVIQPLEYDTNLSVDDKGFYIYSFCGDNHDFGPFAIEREVLKTIGKYFPKEITVRNLIKNINEYIVNAPHHKKY